VHSSPRTKRVTPSGPSNETPRHRLGPFAIELPTQPMLVYRVELAGALPGAPVAVSDLGSARTVRADAPITPAVLTHTVDRPSRMSAHTQLTNALIEATTCTRFQVAHLVSLNAVRTTATFLSRAGCRPL
jgi:hypothetical protein